jgi:FMN phosphatase YigB (HAD superfamily)
MSESKIALFDMDNTLCDYSRRMESCLMKMAHPDEPPLDMSCLTSWEEARADSIKNTPGWWRELHPLSLGVCILKAAMEMGFECHVLTKGPWKTTSAWTEKVEWCREHLPPEVKVTITEDKSLMYGRVLVDDWPDYVDAWLARRPRGLVLMPTYSYNEGYTKAPMMILSPLKISCRSSDRRITGRIFLLEMSSL